MFPILCPTSTSWPASTLIRERCAYLVITPSKCLISIVRPYAGRQPVKITVPTLAE